MRRFLIVLLYCVFSTYAWAQKSNIVVPLQVSQQFSHQFGDIQQVKWNASGNNRYQADFYQNGSKKTVLFSNSGQWLVVENQVSEREIPLKVNQSLAKEFPGYQISDATRMELFGKGTAFRVRVRKGPGIFDVEIGVNGQVNKRTEVYKEREEHHHHEDEHCHHHHDCHHHHKKDKNKHKHKHGKGHGHGHGHDDCEEEDD